MGALKHCNDPSITLKSECVGHFNLTMHQCEWMPSQFATVKCLLNQNKEIDRLFPKVWKNISPWNFDDILNSVLTVFVATSGETWPNMMYDVMNAAGEDQPMHEMHPCWPNNGHWNQVYQSRLLPPLYFIFLTLLCGFLFLNVIVGVIIDEYAKQKESDMENMSKEKRTEWLEHKILSAMHPIQLMNRPHGRCWRRRDQFYDIVTFPSFEKFYDCCIVVNLIVIMFKTANESDTKLNVMMYCDVFFCILFSIECIMKFVAYGMVQYFESNENKIDFFALLSTIIYLFIFVIQDLESDMKLKYTNYGVSVSAQNLFGGMVVFRINRLVKWSSKVQLLVNTFVYAVPSMLYVMIMWFIMYFTFAVLGMNLFAGIKHGDYLNDDANFDTWLNAVNVLLRCSTGEGYNTIMSDLGVQPPYCVASGLLSNCGSAWKASLFFIVFYYMQAFILMNLLIAVILDVFAETNQLAIVIDSTKNHFDRGTVWSVYDDDDDDDFNSRSSTNTRSSSNTNGVNRMNTMNSDSKLQN